MKTMLRLLLIVGVIASTLTAQSLHYPPTTKVEQVDTYFGTQVADPYRWLEFDTAKNVGEWVRAQNEVTFSYLEQIPFRNQVKERMTKLWDYPKYSTPFRAGSNYFFFKNDGLQNQSVLYIQKGLDGVPEVFLDPNRFSSDGTASLGGLAFSKDGKYCAYGISKSGSDWRTFYVMEVESKRKLDEELQWSKFSGIAWYRDGFYYSRYDAPTDEATAMSNKNENHKVYYHVLGAKQSSDILVYEDKANPQRLHGCGVSEDERFLFLSSSQGGTRGNSLYYRDLKSGRDMFVPISQTFDDQFSAVNNFGDKILIRTNKNAPNGKLLLVDTRDPREQNWAELLPEAKEPLSSVTTAGEKIFVTYMKDVMPRVYVYNISGVMENEIPLPMVGSVGGFGGKKEDAFVFFTMTSFTTPSAIYKYDLATRQITLFRKTELDFNDDEYETKQVFFNSKDGTRIPMFIIHKKNVKLNGKNPTMLYGYGGFNASMNPSFDPARLVWLEQGGVYAIANLRGGSEYGEKWHEAGTKLNKQNVFDDFIAAAEYLIKQKYTSSEKLGIYGRSNGGLLIGAVMNQRPDLFRVALPAVGVMDMLRFHKFTIGWAWTNDYGSSDDEAQFKYLYKYSPLHNVRSKVDYPATLVTTADHDDRVVPAHSFKYIATLQEKYKGNNPVLIRIETKAGHGGGKPTSKIIEENADMFAFTWYNMGFTPKW
ncbi:MAG: S9 family peptidase [Ignavibacteriae bacterium]|nr:S9 family peptidase [Ignavibacteriota bacterium]